VLGICVSLHYAGYGRLTGISGLLENAISKVPENWQVSFLCGLYAIGFLYIQFSNEKVLVIQALPTYILIIAGLCVGFGTRMGCGCTSGHGISGLARLSKRGFVGVCSFMATGVLAANVAYFSKFPEPDLQDPFWFVSNKYGGWVLFAISTLVALRELSHENLHSWVFGGLFGLGLSISGMVNNKIVLAFLIFNKNWDPALMFVLAFAVGVFAVTYWARDYMKSKPFYADAHKLPVKTEIDRELVIGELFFGIGWGLAGLCPGPMVAVLSVPAVGTFFLPSVWAGMQLNTLAKDYGVFKTVAGSNDAAVVATSTNNVALVAGEGEKDDASAA